MFSFFLFFGFFFYSFFLVFLVLLLCLLLLLFFLLLLRPFSFLAFVVVCIFRFSPASASTLWRCRRHSLRRLSFSHFHHLPQNFRFHRYYHFHHLCHFFCHFLLFFFFCHLYRFGHFHHFRQRFHYFSPCCFRATPTISAAASMPLPPFLPPLPPLPPFPPLLPPLPLIPPPLPPLPPPRRRSDGGQCPLSTEQSRSLFASVTDISKDSRLVFFLTFIFVPVLRPRVSLRHWHGFF